MFCKLNKNNIIRSINKIDEQIFPNKVDGKENFIHRLYLFIYLFIHLYLFFVFFIISSIFNGTQNKNVKDTLAVTKTKKNLQFFLDFRYLATGSSFVDLGLQFYRGKSTVGRIIRSTCEAIWEILQPIYMPLPDEGVWQEKAQRYFELWNLPNCIGSIDGKHIRIKCFKNTGSRNINYKGFFSVVLMAIADADSLFTLIDVGDIGRNSDGSVFCHSAIGKRLKAGSLNVPKPTSLPGNTDKNPFPYYCVGDEAFPLLPNLLRPFPKKVLNDAKRIFNFRLSRGRKSVECAFGILTSKFRVFEVPMDCDENCVIAVVKAACVLHNFIRLREGKYQESSNFVPSFVVPLIA